MLEVKIIDDEEYEKNKTFTIQLGEPILLEIGQKHGEEKGLAGLLLLVSLPVWQVIIHDKTPLENVYWGSFI